MLRKARGVASREPGRVPQEAKCGGGWREKGFMTTKVDKD
jgi:hypothetical protein